VITKKLIEIIMKNEQKLMKKNLDKMANKVIKINEKKVK
jgi:hypothetical protein